MKINPIFEKNIQMFKKVFILFLFISTTAYTQYSVNGKIDPDNNYSWILLYKLEKGKQVFIENTNINNGEFQFNIPQDQPSGIYRIYYQVENNSFVEFIFNKESVNFIFDPENPTESIKFLSSEENIIYQAYYQTISPLQQQIDSLQMAYFKSDNTKNNKKITKNYKKELTNLQKTQTEFEKRSEGKMANHFIKASAHYNPVTPLKDPQDYINAEKMHFFDSIDFSDPVLGNATFLNDRLTDYVFYLNQSENFQTRNELQQKAIDDVSKKLNNNYTLIKNFDETLLQQYAQEENSEMIDFVLNNYYNNLPKDYQDYRLKFKIQSDMKTAIGKEAPDIVWEENGVSKNLYSLIGTSYYAIVFFSTGCSHCRKEMPVFNEFINEIENIRVITIGLEDEKKDWEIMTANYDSFINILDLDKWKSKKVSDYGITAIPSYFILDANKKIIAKPDGVEELKEMFEEK